jgi:hypothetical protein
VVTIYRTSDVISCDKCFVIIVVDIILSSSPPPPPESS